MFPLLLWMAAAGGGSNGGTWTSWRPDGNLGGAIWRPDYYPPYE